MLNLNKKNLNALSYKAKALMALERNKEALIFIKQALAIKHNKTLYKYLIELENKSNSFNLNMRNDLININKYEEEPKYQFNRKISKNDYKNTNKIKKKQNFGENIDEYKKIFDSSQSDLYYPNEYFDQNGKINYHQNQIIYYILDFSNFNK